MKLGKKKKNALTVMLTTWCIIMSIGIGTYIRINWIPDEYEPAYWFAVCIYGLGVYFAIAAFAMTNED